MALRRVAPLWEKQGRSGPYLSGTVNEDIKKGSVIMIFKNDPNNKKNENSPDATMNIKVSD